jgi:diguanylate cyclase (GGDEF)-like protein
LSTKIDTRKARRELALLRREIAQAKATLWALRADVLHLQSDPGLAAVRGIRAENERLVATNSLAELTALKTRDELDAALKAANTDALTGLRNRAELGERLSHELRLAARRRDHVGVVLLDVDDFKTLNDVRGHGVGDLVLQHVANTLTAAVRSSDLVFRLGGDEFVVVASTAGPGDMHELLRKIDLELCRPFALEGRVTTLSVSAGLSIYPVDASDAQALLQKADEAMYRVKRAKHSART